VSRDEAALAKTLVAILGELIAIPSPFPPGESQAICSYAADRLRRAGYATEVLARKPGVDNVVARLGRGRPALVFNAHVDTVGVGERANWKTDPFTAVVEGGAVFGLGAGNCKGSMAVQLWLAEEIVRRGGPKQGEVVFTFVADEENLGPDGMRFLREQHHVKPDALILGAQTENQLIVAERGVMWARIAAEGKAAHAGNPAGGDNAILRLMRVASAIERQLAPKLAKRVDGKMRSTMNLGQFHGGHNTNVVPAAAWLEIDRRLLPGETVDGAFAELKRAALAAGEPARKLAIELLTGTNGFRAPADGKAIAALSAAIKARTGQRARFLNATGVSDGRYFADDAIEIINFGPGSGAQGHAANESVPIDQMVDAAVIQLDAVERLLGLAGR
jgi:acetylornithine deacetylase/succinyl-diaminopimelate desuccinylase family protein